MSYPKMRPPSVLTAIAMYRRERIIASCLDVIAESGVAGTSHRRIAKAAGVPLGSMTYHFAGIDEILREAFTRFATAQSARFEERMAAASDHQGALNAVVALVVDDVLTDPREPVLAHELYTLAAREPAYRVITTRWMERSRVALQRHFDLDTARMLDALIEGMAIHRALDDHPRDAREVRVAVARIAGR